MPCVSEGPPLGTSSRALGTSLCIPAYNDMHEYNHHLLYDTNLHFPIYPKKAPAAGVASEARCTTATSSPRGIGTYSKTVDTPVGSSS